MTANIIKVDAENIKEKTDSLKEELNQFKDNLIELYKVSMFTRDELTGKAYSTLFEVVDELYEQQQEIVVFQQLVIEEIENYSKDMVSADEKAKDKFIV